MRYGLGYIQSPTDTRDIEFKAGAAVPDEYEVKGLRGVYDQGTRPICAAVGLSTILSWRMSLGEDKVNINPMDVYDLRADKEMEGMILRDAIKAIRKNGVDGATIDSYARVKDKETAKAAILLNGPLIIGTYAFNENNFWKPNGLQQNLGGHATLLVGFDKKGFTLMNSWGVAWGRAGYTTFPYEDWGYILEAWTILL